MEEILASIRRILKEEEGSRVSSDEPDDDMLVLDETMVAPAPGDVPVDAELPGDAQAGISAERETAYAEPEPRVVTRDFVLPPSQRDGLLTDRELPDNKWSLQESNVNEDMDNTVQSPEGLVGDDISTAVVSTIGSLVNSISNERSVTISRAGVTIEDVIREEIKPLLKAWLNTHLPVLVERVVRAEIARVVERTKL